jgi:signal transduction histidine kinase
LPLRPVTVRTILSAVAAEPDEEGLDEADGAKMPSICDLDPGWVLANSAAAPVNPLKVLSDSPYWTAPASARRASEVISHLWRHSVAVGLAARSLAREAADHDPETVARAGLLCRLGCWAVAALEPEWLARWWQEESAAVRRQAEMTDVGTDLDDLGRRLAERWGCEPLVIDAAWMRGAHGSALRLAASDPARLAIIQEACRLVQQTPWSIEGPRSAESMPAEPRLRILIAEVQARCSAAYVAEDASVHEERLARENARLRLRLAAERQARARGDRLLRALADTAPASPPEEWAGRAAITWCSDPEFSAARVTWVDAESPRSSDVAKPATSLEGDPAAPPKMEETPATLVLPLKAHGRTRAFVHLWSPRDPMDLATRVTAWTTFAAWESWAALVEDRARLERRLQSVVGSFRQLFETEEERLADRKRDALSEFAAGAGHELNNPLAVVVGRAQLLLARTNDPETARSLRLIIGQAGRAHCILRDLMFVARPPEGHRRLCRLPDLLRATMREFQKECVARGIRLTTELDEAVPAFWTDPDGLRHLAEILLRNAVEATSAGGKIQVGANVQGNELIWWFSDSGAGIAPKDAVHLFDPFYCGRQAGRGLGLGLPRAARIVALAGGQIRWSANPGHGTTFKVHLPLAAAPEPANQPARSASPV